MDSIKYLLGMIVKLASILFVAAFLIAVINHAYPDMLKPSLSGGGGTAIKGDWLPAPRNMIKEAPRPGEDGTYGTTYQHGTPFSGYETEPDQYITYSSGGQQPDGGNVTSPAGRTQYVRNLNLYEGAAITHGMTIYGESRDFMFRNGIFQIVIADRSGKGIVSMPAMNLDMWSIPGWARWKAVVPIKLPPNLECLLVFISADGRAVATFPVRCG